jgi:outer membrane protein assembly factor BamA
MRKCALVVCFVLCVHTLYTQPNSPVRAVRVQELAINGLSNVPATELAAIESEIKQRCCAYAETQEIRERIVYAFQERGYYEARINRVDVTPMATNAAPPAVNVAVDVSNGRRFRLRTIQFRGNEALSTAELRQQFRIEYGEILNVDKIRQGLEGLRRVYASQGYINFTPVPNTEADEKSATVTLTIDVDEGKQFRLGGLLLDGEEPHAGDGAKLLEAWKPMEGGVYNGLRIEEWWQLAATMLPPGARLEQMLGLKQDAASVIVTGYLQFPDSR